VFVGHAARDEQFVRPIVAALRERNFEPWVDYEEIDPTGRDAIARIRKVIESVPTAVFIFGVDGAGPWQATEFQFVQDRVARGQMQMVKVLLPGGKVPPDLDVGRAIQVTDPEDPETLDQLEWAITGIRPLVRYRGDYEIHVVVPTAGCGCFIAAAHSGSNQVYETIRLAAADVGLTVAQPLHQGESKFAPDVPRAILTAHLIVADCSLDPATDLISPQVAYQLGLAKAWGKAGILVTSGHADAMKIYALSPTDIVEFDGQAEGWTTRLREELAASMTRVLRDLRHPHLVRPNLNDVHVTYSESFRQRAVLWRSFQGILRYGLTVRDAFRAVEKHVHAMHRHVERVWRDSVLEGRDFSRDWNAFHAEFDAFKDEEKRHPELSVAARPASTEPATGHRDIGAEFDFLKQKLTGHVRQHLDKSRRAYDAAGRDMDEYAALRQSLIQLVGAEHSDLTPRCHPLRRHCENLAKCVNEIHHHLSETMVALLRLIGVDPGSGGPSA
jgi:hypothetical protein